MSVLSFRIKDYIRKYTDMYAIAQENALLKSQVKHLTVKFNTINMSADKLYTQVCDLKRENSRYISDIANLNMKISQMEYKQKNG